MPAANELIQGFCEGIAPIKRITVSEWGNKYRILSSVGSARPGPYDIRNSMYLKDIADDLSESSEVQEVVFKKAAQIGATEVGNNWVGYIIHIAPAATLMVMPTDETVKTNSQIRFDPMINDTPELRKRIPLARSRDSRNKTSQKSFPGGVILFKGAQSPKGLRSLPIKNVILDELDAYPQNIGGEGSGMKLAKARTWTYKDKRKIFALSTPTIDGQSAIQKEYENSDQRKYYVCCPHCGGEQLIEWERIKWDVIEGVDKPETAHLVCLHCNEKIQERYKFDMVQRGRWIATNLAFTNRRRRGYHINALYSTLGYKWSDAVIDYLDGTRDLADMITFVNTVLGEVWVDVREVPDWEALYNRREPYQIGVPPAKAAFLTMGVDIQKDRIEAEVVAWCKNKVSYSVEYHVLVGDTTVANMDGVWGKLDEVINKTYTREDGAQMPIHMTCIDSSDNTNTVYAFCRRYSPDRVVPIKGRDELMSIFSRPQSIDIMQDGKPVNVTKLYGLGVSLIKSELYGWLRQMKLDDVAEPIGYSHFPMYPESYFKMLTAEQKKLKTDKKGREKWVWTLPSRARNEALDCRVYARGAASIFQMDRFEDEHWDNLASSYPLKEDKDIRPADDSPAEKGGGFLGDMSSFWKKG